MLDRMLSVASLSALSGTIGSVQPTPVRFPGGQPAPAAMPPPSPPQLPTVGNGSAAPTRLLPRGSLVDLSV